VQCTSPKPANAQWLSAGVPFDTDNCSWACGEGHVLLMNNTCVAAPIPASVRFCHVSYTHVLYIVSYIQVHEFTFIKCLQCMFSNTRTCKTLFPQAPATIILSSSQSKLSTQEGPGSATNPPASLSLLLSKQPTASVTVSITCNGTQLRAATPASITFTTSNWNIEQGATVAALDDTAVEGLHSGTCKMSVTSGDAQFDKISLPPVTIDITDNDCPAVPTPANGLKLSCNETYGGSCRVQCKLGYAPAREQQLYCDAVTGLWQQPQPTCDACDAGYYNASGSCVPCAVELCPVGMYRSACAGDADGQYGSLLLWVGISLFLCS
jgi:hypothetical protein